MATPGTPQWWLEQLSDKLIARNTMIATLRSYASGEAPLPEGAEGMREAYRAFQRKARTNFGSLIVEAVRERMTPAGFLVGDNDELDRAANEIWAANQLDVFSGDVHQDMLTVGYGYALINGPEPKREGFWSLFKSKPGMPVITREDPALMITAHDPLMPQRVVAALKLFHDEVDGKDYAYLYLPGVCYVAEKASGTGQADPDLTAAGYTFIDTRRMPKGYEDVVPIVCFTNNDGMGEFQAHTDLLDRINYMVLQRLVLTAMQAFRQRAVKGELPEYVTDANGAPVLDDDGAPVPLDYNSIFTSGPGSLWVLPEGMDLWESSVTDLTPVLTAVKDDLRALAAVTRTPMSTLMPEGENQSAEGASFAREGLVFKTKDRAKRATYGWNEVMGLALRFAGKPADSVQVQWEEIERRSLSEKADAASKATDLPYHTKLTKIWGFSPAEAERMETERINDMMVGTLGSTIGETNAV